MGDDEADGGMANVEAVKVPQILIDGIYDELALSATIHIRMDNVGYGIELAKMAQMLERYTDDPDSSVVGRDDAE